MNTSNGTHPVGHRIPPVPPPLPPLPPFEHIGLIIVMSALFWSSLITLANNNNDNGIMEKKAYENTRRPANTQARTNAYKHRFKRGLLLVVVSTAVRHQGNIIHHPHRQHHSAAAAIKKRRNNKQHGPTNDNKQPPPSTHYGQQDYLILDTLNYKK